MPEGLEIYILSHVLQNLGFKVQSYGKHLYLKDKKEDWSFGLNGKVKIIRDEKKNHLDIIKVDTGFVIGNILPCDTLDDSIKLNKLGIDWITASLDDIQTIVNEKWKNSRKQLGTLLLEQSLICGLATAGSSEILDDAKLKPEIKANEQDLSCLATSIINIRNQALKLYMETITANLISVESQITFVNEWYKNLYKFRKMKVGSSLVIKLKLAHEFGGHD